MSTSSIPCPECTKLHSVLTGPERRLASDNTYRAYLKKHCICGYFFGEVIQVDYSAAWKVSKPVENKAIKAIKDEESQAVMTLWDDGKSVTDIARILGLNYLHTKYVVAKIIKAYPGKSRVV